MRFAVGPCASRKQSPPLRPQRGHRSPFLAFVSVTEPEYRTAHPRVTEAQGKPRRYIRNGTSPSWCHPSMRDFADDVQPARVSDGGLRWSGRRRVQLPEPRDSRPRSADHAVRPRCRTIVVLALLRRLDRATQVAVAAGMRTTETRLNLRPVGLPTVHLTAVPIGRFMVSFSPSG